MTVPKWRMVGRPFDPRQKAPSRGEARARTADAVVYGMSGAIAAFIFLYIVAEGVLF